MCMNHFAKIVKQENGKLHSSDGCCLYLLILTHCRFHTNNTKYRCIKYHTACMSWRDVLKIDGPMLAYPFTYRCSVKSLEVNPEKMISGTRLTITIFDYAWVLTCIIYYNHISVIWPNSDTQIDEILVFQNYTYKPSCMLAVYHIIFCFSFFILVFILCLFLLCCVLIQIEHAHKLSKIL